MFLSFISLLIGDFHKSSVLRILTTRQFNFFNNFLLAIKYFLLLILLIIFKYLKSFFINRKFNWDIK